MGKNYHPNLENNPWRTRNSQTPDAFVVGAAAHVSHSVARAGSLMFGLIIVNLTHQQPSIVLGFSWGCLLTPHDIRNHAQTISEWAVWGSMPLVMRFIFQTWNSLNIWDNENRCPYFGSNPICVAVHHWRHALTNTNFKTTCAFCWCLTKPNHKRGEFSTIRIKSRANICIHTCVCVIMYRSQMRTCIGWYVSYVRIYQYTKHCCHYRLVISGSWRFTMICPLNLWMLMFMDFPHVKFPKG